MKNEKMEAEMKKIYDCNGHLTCMVDSQTGLIESEYKRSKMRSYLDEGEYLEFERQGARTRVRRTPNGGFLIESEIL